jgi:hypothetical protein
LAPVLAPVLALHGVPAAAAEPIVLMAEILGWQVRCCAPGIAVPAHLCIAPLPAAPAEPADDLPALLLWSPQNNLNEHISANNASVLEQPICIHHVEQMLQALGHHATGTGKGNPAARQQKRHDGATRGAAPWGGATSDWGRDDEDCHARRS